ncbi:MAG: 3'-5' exonuclease [Coriobacteriales bacterium]|jgi:DNA polymerase-3 subunit epsilon|nr:3'-5' exonuclease [Coriobacteriales bacterium]
MNEGTVGVETAEGDAGPEPPQDPEQKIVVIDTETTGLSKGKDEVLQVAIIDSEGGVLLHELIKPEKRKSWPKAEEIHGVSPAMVKDAKPLVDYADRIVEIVNEADIVIGYNVEFDLEMLFSGGVPLDLPNIKAFDVMKEFAEVYGDFDERRCDYRYKTLKVCANYYKYKFDAHDALADARATLYCYGQMEDRLRKKREQREQQQIRERADADALIAKTNAENRSSGIVAIMVAVLVLACAIWSCVSCSAVLGG